MTAKQKANQARFKKVVAEAKKLRKKNPKLSQAQAVKQAWSIMYSKTGTSKKKVGAVKKKVAKKKTTAKSFHKDTKSHNVNIKVVSGLPRTKKFINIPAKQKTWFRYYVNGFYGKKGVQADKMTNNGFTKKELNKRLNMFFKTQHETGVNSWNKGDSVDRERFRDLYVVDFIKKGSVIF